MDVLLERPPWFLVGPLLGVIVVAVFTLLHERLGVLGGYGELVERAAGVRRTLGWKAWFVVGIVLGGVAFGVAGGGWRAGGSYGWLEDPLATGAVLAGGGVLIGVGAKAAGGCTSGNGLSGCSFGSPASMVATATFMATAVGSAFALRWLLA